MRFKIISTGWNCAPYVLKTLESIRRQSRSNWDLAVVVDPCPDNTIEIVQGWMAEHPDLSVTLLTPSKQQFATRNQVEAINALEPEDEDVIIFLDLDGDQFAHRDVLAHLEDDYYADDTLVTYGNYRPDPPNPLCQGPKPFPPEVVENRTYRNFILKVYCAFNHLRTMKGKVYKAIPPNHFTFHSGRSKGSWYTAGTDYVFMMAALEIADGRYKCIDEVLCVYNSGNPHADNKEHANESTRCHMDILRRPNLPPLIVPEETPVPAPAPVSTVVESLDDFLPAEARRRILRDFGRTHDLDYFIETGTNDGETTWFLKDEFTELHTIELGHRQWKAAKQRFRGEPHVHCHHGDSAKVLPEVLRGLLGPALIWLDGHYSGPGTAQGGENTPAIKELEAIIADGRPHVVLIDDARCFGGGAHNPIGGTPAYDHYSTWPTLDELRDVAEAGGYSWTVEDDIIRLIP